MSDIVNWTSYLFAIAILVALLGGLGLFGYAIQKGWLLQQMTGLRQLGGQDRRLRICETLVIDPRRRLVILQADGTEHLVLLGMEGETVLSTGQTLSDAVTPDTLKMEQRG
ncbi:flagellar biosynthetic protein FliO [Maricaulis sp.]|uniref:flagellar biosynthetic protein FliO n=1 Tax=Maricaulis sp. TaxID=1486257 RepID=UPI0025BB83B0|nr:flagellar biosynthetic protein FliO [Maricaulis sp.]